MSKATRALLNNEQDYNLISHFRNMETQQLENYKNNRKTTVQQMLMSNYDTQNDFKKTSDGFWSKEQKKPSGNMTEMIENGRMNSTENFQKLK